MKSPDDDGGPFISDGNPKPTLVSTTGSSSSRSKRKTRGTDNITTKNNYRGTITIASELKHNEITTQQQ